MNSGTSARREKIHFITGRLAEPALRSTLAELSVSVGFDYSVQVMPITVAALMTPSWIAPRLKIPEGTTKLMLPGYCEGDLQLIRDATSVPVELGPRDLRRLPEHFGKPSVNESYGQWDIELIAEINQAPRLDSRTILEMARSFQQDGANYIDIGCEPNSCWTGVADCVSMLRNEGSRVSIDSLNPLEIAPAVKAGAELVLSVNSTNRESAVDWGCEVVVIPDVIHDLDSLEETVEYLAQHNVPLRIDPILEPIGFNFAASLQRYFQARQRWPEAPMMMGIGNLTELTAVDSAGVNLILLAICQELGIRSVLTTQVVNWARTSVKECDVARKLVFHAIEQKVLPKHVDDQLVILRDEKLVEFGKDHLTTLAERIQDNNYRIFAESGLVHLLGGGKLFSGKDPFEVFDSLLGSGAKNIDPSHAFYLGFEMCKALTALQLGKQYTQDESLDWGFLTQPEKTRHRLKKVKRNLPNR
jgi:dihydropteroate synthase-like protein